MKKITLALLGIIPTSAFACFQSSYETAINNTLMLLAVIFGPISFIALIILSIFLSRAEYKDSKKIKRFQILSIIIFVISFLVFIGVAINNSLLCSSATF